MNMESTNYVMLYKIDSSYPSTTTLSVISLNFKNIPLSSFSGSVSGSSRDTTEYTSVLKESGTKSSFYYAQLFTSPGDTDTHGFAVASRLSERSTGSWSIYNKVLMPLIVKNDELYENFKTYFNSVTDKPVYSIKGKFKIKTLNKLTGTPPYGEYRYKSSGSTIQLYTLYPLYDVLINNVLYDCIFLNAYKTATYSSPNVVWGDSTTFSISDIYGLEHNSDTWSSLTLNVNDVIELNQDYTLKGWYDWINTNTDPLYENTFVIKSLDGTETLATLEEAPPMVSAIIYTKGNSNATLELVGSNGKTYTLDFEVPQIENYNFLGLSLTPNYKGTPLIPSTGETVSIALDNSTTLYLTYGYYFTYTKYFELNLFNSTAEPNRVDKESYLTTFGTLTGVLRNESSIFNPTITFELTDVPTFNYVYIPIWNRYYYVENITSIKNNLWQMSLKCDVLMSFKDGILDLECIVDRQEFDTNNMLVDTQIPTQKNATIEYELLEDSPFNTVDASDYLGKSYVFTVIGGKK